MGLPAHRARRVPGLRREEVAVLAGISVPCCTRLERGDMAGVSESVLAALARALQLVDVELSRLFDLARAAQPMTASRRRPRPSSDHGSALYAEMFVSALRPANSARFVFLDAHSRDF